MREKQNIKASSSFYVFYYVGTYNIILSASAKSCYFIIRQGRIKEGLKMKKKNKQSYDNIQNYKGSSFIRLMLNNAWRESVSYLKSVRNNWFISKYTKNQFKIRNSTTTLVRSRMEIWKLNFDMQIGVLKFVKLNCVFQNPP